MKLYNTLTRAIEPFKPRGDEVNLYVCGITPYDTTHIGHAFTYTGADVLIRYLELRGSKVNYVQNVTDIDDDVLRRAKAEREDWLALGNSWTQYYIRDMQDLNVLPPDHFPRATEMIQEIIQSVERLLIAGLAYQAGGSVYYAVEKYPTFGKLSGLPRDEWLPTANQRGNQPDDPNKRDPIDFVLWQAQAPGEPSWPSPWGPGRPGWHIECSTMATKYLKGVVDIHGGGDDLCFPHHECEIAQVEPVNDYKPFVRFWMHTAMVRYEREKMSKSLKNLVMVRELLPEYSPDELRLYLANHHYRMPWDYDEKELKKTQKVTQKLREAVLVNGGDGTALNAEMAWASFTADMDNDLDTPGAIRGMESLADEVLEAAQGHRDVSEAQEALRKFSNVFGLRLDQDGPEERVLDGWRKHLEKFAEPKMRPAGKVL